MDRKIYRPRQMAEELQITEPSLRTLLRLGMPFMQVRKAIWIDREKALDWLAQFEKRKDQKLEGAAN
jgi:transposase-like protein